MDRPPPPAPAPMGRPGRTVVVLLSGLVAVSIICRGVSAFVRAFDRDEFLHWYTAWMVSAGMAPGRDFSLPYVYTPIVDGLRFLFRLFPDSLAPLFLSRAAIFALGLVVLWLVFRIGCRLTGSLPAALLGVLFVTFHPEIVRRIGDVRWDILNVLCVLAACLALLRGPGRLPALLAGAAVGAGLVSSPKGVVALPPILCLGFLLHGRAWWKRGLELLGGCVVPVLLYLGFLELSGLGPPYREAYARFLRLATDPATGFSPARVLVESFRRSPAAPLLVACCLVAALAGWRSSPKDEKGGRAGSLALCAVLYAFLYVVANPAFYPYNFVDVVPVLALAVPAAAAGWERRRGTEIARLAALVGVLLAVAGARETVWSTWRSNGLQLRYLDYIRAAVRPEERVFDLNGTHLFRFGTYHWHLTVPELSIYRRAPWFSISDELRRHRVSLIVKTDRLQWLSEKDWAFIRSHYVWAEPLLMFPGHLFQERDGRRQRFEIVVPGDYRFRSERPDGLRVDGLPMGEKLFLAAGWHTLEFASSPNPSFALVYTTPEREAHHLGAKLGEELVPSEQ